MVHLWLPVFRNYLLWTRHHTHTLAEALRTRRLSIHVVQGMRFVTELTELVEQGIMLNSQSSPGFFYKDIPHAQVMVQSLFKSYRTVGKGMVSYRTHKTYRVGGYKVVQNSQNVPRKVWCCTELPKRVRYGYYPCKYPVYTKRPSLCLWVHFVGHEGLTNLTELLGTSTNVLQNSQGYTRVDKRRTLPNITLVLLLLYFIFRLHHFYSQVSNILVQDCIVHVPA